MKLAIDNKKLNILHSNLIYPLLAFPLWKENITMLFFVVFTLFNIRSFLITKKIVGLTKIEGWILFIPFLIVFFSSLFRNEIAENKEALNHSGLFIAIPISFFIMMNS